MRLISCAVHPISNRRWFHSLLILGILLCCQSGLGSTSAQAQSGSPASSTTVRHTDDATKIVLLGISHFAGSATDEYSSIAEDILSAQRQQELDTVATRLADFEPDQFMVERTPDRQHTLDSLYEAYRSGSYHPTAEGHSNEIYQLGFRAADRAGLSGVRAVDAEGLWLGDQAQSVAKRHDPELLNAFREYGKRMSSQSPKIRSRSTIGEWLTTLNSDSLLYSNHKAYIYYLSRMGTFDATVLQTHWEGDLDGRSFFFTGDFGGYPISRAKDIVHAIGGRVADSIHANLDYVVQGQHAEAIVQEARDRGAEVLSIDEAQKMIMTQAKVYVGFPDHHVGADLVGEWYKRNLRIYANIWQAAESNTDRIVAMFGQGHIWTLRQFFRENPDFEVVPVRTVL